MLGSSIGKGRADLDLVLRWDEGALWKSKRWNRSEVRWGGRLWWRRTRRSWSRWKDGGAGSSAAIHHRLLRRSSLPPQTLSPSPWRQLHSDQTPFNADGEIFLLYAIQRPFFLPPKKKNDPFSILFFSW